MSYTLYWVYFSFFRGGPTLFEYRHACLVVARLFEHHVVTTSSTVIQVYGVAQLPAINSPARCSRLAMRLSRRVHCNADLPQTTNDPGEAKFLLKKTGIESVAMSLIASPAATSPEDMAIHDHWVLASLYLSATSTALINASKVTAATRWAASWASCSHCL